MDLFLSLDYNDKNVFGTFLFEVGFFNRFVICESYISFDYILSKYLYISLSHRIIYGKNIIQGVSNLNIYDCRKDREYR